MQIELNQLNEFSFYSNPALLKDKDMLSELKIRPPTLPTDPVTLPNVAANQLLEEEERQGIGDKHHRSFEVQIQAKSVLSKRRTYSEPNRKNFHHFEEMNRSSSEISTVDLTLKRISSFDSDDHDNRRDTSRLLKMTYPGMLKSVVSDCCIL